MLNARIVTNPKSILILAGALSACMAGAATAQPYTFLAGDVDDFGGSYATEDALPMRPVLAQYLSRVGGVNQILHNSQPMPFDTESRDWEFGYTFMDLPTLYEGATLEIRMKATSGLSTNDSLHLQYTSFGEGLSNLWSDSIADLNGTWNFTDITTLTLNLSDLPGFDGSNGSFIDLVNDDGYLDVYITDDTSVDWIRLTVPAPGTASLIALGGMVAMRRRR